MQEHVSALYALDPGCPREQWVRICFAYKAAGGTEDEFLTWSKGGANFDKANAITTWRNAKIGVPGGVTENTLFMLAHKAGWKPSGGNGGAGPPMARRTPTRKPLPDAAPLVVVDPSPTWAKAVEAITHAYLSAKHVSAHGTRVDNNGWLLVPYHDATGRLQTLQRIGAERDAQGQWPKLFTKGAKQKGSAFILGEPRNAGVVCVCEGFATACTIHEATGYAVLASGSRPVMPSAAEMARTFTPQGRVVLCVDRGDLATPIKAARAVGAFLAAPGPEDSADGFDFNDWAQSASAAEIRARIDFAQPPAPEAHTEVAAVLETDEAPPPAEFSSDALGESYLHAYARVTLYCEALGFMVWTGKRWERGEAIVSERMHRCAARMADEVLSTIRDTRARATLARKVCSSGYVSAAMSYVRAFRFIRDANAFDPDPWALNTPGGLVDLRTGHVRDATPEDMVTKLTGVSPLSLCERAPWDRFINEITCGDVELAAYHQRAGGYTLTGDTALHFMPFYVGTGRNGKSTFCELLEHVAGDYFVKLDVGALMEHDHERHADEIAQLRGVRLAISSEASSAKRWNEGRIKELTGDASVSAHFMRQSWFTFRRSHHHVVCGNSRPIMNGVDDAIASRIHVVPFNAQFLADVNPEAEPVGHRYPLDPQMSTRLRECAPAILAWFIEGARKVWQGGLALPMCAAVKEASKEYADEMNWLKQFVDEECTLSDSQARTPAATLYSRYATWKERRGEHPVNQKRFSEEFQRRFRKVKGHTAMMFEGVAVVPRAPSLNLTKDSGDEPDY